MAKINSANCITKSRAASNVTFFTALSSTAVAAIAAICFAAPALAHNGPHGGGLDTQGNPLQPATRYSGATPIDMKNGIPWDNGTFGLPNEDYEEWSKSLTAVGISERAYPYDQRERFIDAYADRMSFFQVALENWGQSTSETKPEAIEYGKQAIQTITPKYDKAKDALSNARGAGSGNWDGAQSDARRALVDLQSTYYAMHHNPAKH